MPTTTPVNAASSTAPHCSSRNGAASASVAIDTSHSAMLVSQKGAVNSVLSSVLRAAHAHVPRIPQHVARHHNQVRVRER